MCLHFAILSYSEKLWNVFEIVLEKYESVCSKIGLVEKIFLNRKFADKVLWFMS